MLSRSLAILLAPLLPAAALIFPLGPAHVISALVAGILAMVLSAFSFVDDRARLGTVLLGAWVALSPFVFDSTLLEEVLTVSWGVTMFVCAIGPFSDTPRSSWTAAPQPAGQAVVERDRRAA
jgi:hypothetical protein